MTGREIGGWPKGKEIALIGVATRLDPLPTTFDHPRWILRRRPASCQYLSSNTFNAFASVTGRLGSSCSPVVCRVRHLDSKRRVRSLHENHVVYWPATMTRIRRMNSA